MKRSTNNLIVDVTPAQATALLLLFAVMYTSAVYLGLGLYFSVNNVATIWPGSGLFMGALLVTPYRYWAAIIPVAMISQITADNLAGDPGWLNSLSFALNNCMEPVVGALLLRRFCGGAPNLGKTSHVFAVILIGAFVSTLPTSLGGSMLVSIFRISGSAYWDIFQVWWFADILGVLITIPVILAFSNRANWSPLTQRSQFMELGAITAVLLLVLVVVFGKAPAERLFVLDHPYILFPIMLWLTMRFDVRVVTIALLACTLAVVELADIGVGPFVLSGRTVSQVVLSVQTYVTILVCSSVVMIAMITERRRLEADRQDLERQLRRQQRLEALGTLAAGVAHEINNPLTGVINYGQLIDDQLDPKDPLQQYARAIVEQGQNMATTVRKLLAFSRQEPGNRERCTIEEIINDTLLLIETVISQDRIILDIDLPENLHTISCNKQEIQQVIMNLITNAQGALNERYPDRDDNKIMRVTASNIERDGARWVRTTVEDHGHGVKPDNVEHLFDPYFTTKPIGAGTGLGLWISYGIVRDHGGEISLQSEPGQATRFQFDLPCEERARQDHRAQPAS